MRKELYLDDSYLKEFDSKVVSVSEGKVIILNNTVFYPSSGGQPCDHGKLIRDNYDSASVWSIKNVIKKDGMILHEIEGPDELREGDEVRGVLDWERRYNLMRGHTSAHIVSGIVHNQTGAKITGNQIELDKVRIDFELEDFDKEAFKKYIDESNELISQDLPIEVSYISREEAEKDPSLAKLATGLPQGIEEIRVVDIVGFDKQADGGTHVKHLNEVGQLELIECKNKGKNNRRVYYKVI